MPEPGRPEVPISPSVQALMNLGGVSPSVEATRKLEFKSELPDIRMQATDPLSQAPDGQLSPEQMRLRLEMQNQLMGYKTSAIEAF